MDSKSAFFVSDIHLKTMASPSGEAFLSLVRRAQKEASLFVILGDLFDLWIGEARVFQKEYAPILEEIKKLRKTCRVVYFEGNHDLHLEKFWRDQLGCEVYTSPREFEFEGLKIWAEHGDEINQDDKAYLLLRWFMRSPVAKKIMTSAPSELVRAVGTRWSKQSRKHSIKKHNDPKIRDLYREYAKRLRRQKNFDLLVTGHSHILDDYEFKTEKGDGRLINLGSWFDSPKYLRINGGILKWEKEC